MPTNSPDYSTWFTKQTAAAAMGVSVKTIENLGTQKKVDSALWRNPAGGPQMRVYSPDDVQRLVSAKQAAGWPQFVPIVRRGGSPAAGAPPLQTGLAIPAISPQSVPPSLGNVMETLLLEIAEKQATKQLATTKLCLTIPEAAEFAGVSMALIRRGCVDETLGAFQDGRVWRIPRARLVTRYGSPQP